MWNLRLPPWRSLPAFIIRGGTQVSVPLAGVSRKRELRRKGPLETSVTAQELETSEECQSPTPLATPYPPLYFIGIGLSSIHEATVDLRNPILANYFHRNLCFTESAQELWRYNFYLSATLLHQANAITSAIANADPYKNCQRGATEVRRGQLHTRTSLQPV